MAQENYNHPFEPYDIQRQLMKAVYDCIQDKKVGIFESPTGTGKSLSLICASLTWLREHKRAVFDASLQSVDQDEDEPAWMVEHARKARIDEALRVRAEFEERLARVRAQEQKLRKSNGHAVPIRKKARLEATADAISSDETFVLDDYESGDETRNHGAGALFSESTQQMLLQFGMLQQKSDSRSLEDNEESLKVYICSRTHSQLSQFVGELQRVRLPSSLLDETDMGDSAGERTVEAPKQIALGSRKNLCINTEVQRLELQASINERCLELQASGKSTEHCSFALKHDRPEQVLDFRDHALAQIRDIEDLAAVGKHLNTCPYYASRAALGPAEVVLLPYPLLLQRAARESMGISLKGCVVIIDEAHNLIDAVESTYSCQISHQQLQTARQNLMTYLLKYRARLKGSNRMYIAQVVRVIDSLLGAVQSFMGNSGTTTPEVLLGGKNTDQINLNKLAKYISESKLARKVQGYTSFVKATEQRDDLLVRAQGTPILTMVQNFLLTVANPSAEGCFLWDRDSGGDISLRYILLDPSQHFRDIVEEARAVILAGGTMSPMQDHITHLFPYLDDVRTMSCGHIVPPSNILVRAISDDQNGTFEFTYKTRSDIHLVRRLGIQLISIAERVKGGMVVFFASYAYLEFVQKNWATDSTLQQMRATKAVFFDGRAQPAERTFQDYTEAVHKNANGAMLFSVIGGKLSEGINFSDDLGRCVVVVGMPYPNLETPDWQAKLKYFRQRAATKDHAAQNNISRDFAENICMRAVNQAVGRAIRHKDDWACILLIDARYARTRIQDKLPSWLKTSLPSAAPKDASAAAKLDDDLRLFFHDRRATI